MKKRYEDLTFTDDFMFCKVLANNEDLCKELLELILDYKIEIVQKLGSQHSIEIAPDHKGIRLDVHLVGDDRIFNLEMQNEKRKELPKRSRYYQALIDLEQMEKGAKYTELKDTYVIFICPFDPLGAGLPKYTIHPIIDETDEIKYNDGTTKVFLSCESTANKNISDGLKGFLEYVAGRNTTSNLARRLEKAVEKAKLMKSWRKEYMLLDEIHDEGFDEGERNATLTIAATMKADNVPIAEIIKYTGLSEEEINNL